MDTIPIQTDLIIKKIPVIELTSATDYVAVGSILITAFLVVASVYMTRKAMMQQTKDAEDRNQLELDKFIATNRQEWINGLRLAVSDYIAAIQRFDYYMKGHKIKLDTLDDTSSEHYSNKFISIYDQLETYESEVFCLKTKIALYLNPEEQESQELLGALEELYQVAKDEELEDGHPKFWRNIERAEKTTQNILKKEWVRIKTLDKT
ncbi:hypothetical protein D5E87_25830 [Vibrio parahaemolyticus]|uniref:hypothetical protein n=2 Tax=Vibrio parahaemolyticus TaxID=670 RepID=UPI0004A3FF41|nr:hypothetical protein [Vibrio parahaemolyticus]EGR1569471.1 hypothetical protein [Vibrio parahaemolyticus]EIE7521296.1 hypothetical protein [Vibrio parahaemolyticus]EIQ1514438.1 hypothetical protein [Vibrio parahaemolyticus]EJC7971288.1 hypothetical protein [Vibrio parahaemolyticus]EJT1887603.1 hypothetical protein [Vibrio parahaemolyticus]